MYIICIAISLDFKYTEWLNWMKGQTVCTTYPKHTMVSALIQAEVINSNEPKNIFNFQNCLNS